jgi:hypothetical protein
MEVTLKERNEASSKFMREVRSKVRKEVNYKVRGEVGKDAMARQVGRTLSRKGTRPEAR